MANPTVGQAIGLQSVPTQVIPALRERNRIKQGEEAARRKAEEKEFDILMADLDIDPSKYHRLDRDRAMKLAQTTLQKGYDLYSKRNPNWANEFKQELYNWKFQDGQIQVDSKDKFGFEKYYQDPTTLKTPEADAIYNIYQKGSFGDLSKVKANPYGQITAVDPETGRVGYVPAKHVNVPQYVDKTIYDPALSGYAIDPNKKRQAGKDEFYREDAIYDDPMVQAGLMGSAGGDAFNNWRLTYSDNIKSAIEANPTAAPEEIIMDMWVDYGKSLKPTKFREVRVTPPAQTNININNGEVEAKKETLFSNYSNLGTAEISDPNKPLSFENFNSQVGGKIIYREGTDDPESIEISVPSQLTTKTVEIPPNRAKIGKEPLKERTQGKMARQVFMWGTIGSDGQIDTKSQAEYNNLSPEERKKVVPYLKVFYEETAPETKGGEVILGEDGEQKYGLTGRTFTVTYNMSQGSPQVDELNAIDPALTITAKQKTEQGTGKPGAYETTPKIKGQTTPENTETKLTFAEWKKNNPEGTVPQYNQYKAQ